MRQAQPLPTRGDRPRVTVPSRAAAASAITLDDPHRPYPAPVPPCHVRAIRIWQPDDGSGVVREEQADPATQYYAPGQPLGTQLGTESIFINDRPGRLQMSYLFNNPEASVLFLLMVHPIRYVAGAGAPPGATVLGSTEAPIAANPEAPA